MKTILVIIFIAIVLLTAMIAGVWTGIGVFFLGLFIAALWKAAHDDSIY